MSASTLSELLPLLQFAGQGLIVLLVVSAISLLLRRASAASRHLVWGVALIALVVLPVLKSVLPTWHCPLPLAVSREADVSPLASASLAPNSFARSNRADVTPRFDRERLDAKAVTAPQPSDHGKTRHTIGLFTVVMVCWGAGLAICLTPLLIGLVVVQLRARAGREVTTGDWPSLVSQSSRILGIRSPVRLLEGAPGSMPVACGLFRHTIFMPPESADWPASKRRSVLLHELAHIKRRDCLTQTLALLGAAMHWFNPLAWVAIRRLRIERERACDDRVIALGARGSEYAQCVLDVARTLQGCGYSAMAALSMARPSQLEGRLLAILDPRRNQRRYQP